MMKQHRPLDRKYLPGDRAGFTMIEILIAMVVILFLAGLLLGAVVLVRGRVRLAQQTAEVTQINLALNKFKQQFGIFPPSRIRLREWEFPTGAGNPSGTAYDLSDPFDAHSVAYLRRVWPGIKLWIENSGNTVELPPQGGTSPNASMMQWYFDSTGVLNMTDFTRVYELEGDQCLVFFLAGITEKRGDGDFILHGFSDDPTNPSRIPNTLIPKTLNRTPAFYAFDTSRLVIRNEDLTGTFVDALARPAESDPAADRIDFYLQGATPDPDRLGRLPGYLAPTATKARPTPMAYFSSYEGKGYRPDDMNMPSELYPDPAEQIRIKFQLTWPRITDNTNSPSSLAPNPYTRTLAVPAANKVVQAYEPRGYQLIIPGADGEYGAGGSQADYSNAALNPNASWSLNEDNLTNFSAGAPLKEFVGSQAGQGN